ncbi:MAG: hypothetical protein J6252_06355 [Clostridia bacterium]|nr:hypothetical protein [Clostridia bacterium]
MKRLIALLLCAVFCTGLLAGCSSLKEDEKGAIIRVALTQYPQTLDPAMIQLNSDAETILSLIFEPLVTIDSDGKIQPALSTEWYYKFDKIYQLHKMYFVIKETSWSDNRPVRADDVIYAWRRILDPAIDSPYASLLYPIKGARSVKSGLGTIDDLGLAAVDDKLLEVTFEEDYDTDLFLESIANIHLCPAREDIITRSEKAGDDWASSAGSMACNGPFRVQSMEMPHEKKDKEDQDWTENFACRLVLERNAYYMRTDDEQALDKYVLPYRIACYYFEGQYTYYPDEKGITQEQFQANRFDSGESFLLSVFNKETYAKYESDLEKYSTLTGYGFYFNTANEVLADAGVRKSLSASLDRNAFVELLGTGAVPATGYVPARVFNTGRKDDFRKEGGDLFSASAAEGSRGRGSFTITYLIPENEYTHKDYSRLTRGAVDYSQNIYQNFAEKAAETWNKLGYDVSTNGLYYKDFLTALKSRDYDVIALNTAMGSVDPFAYLAPYAMQYSGTGVEISIDEASEDEIFNPHYTNLNNKEYNELIDSIIHIKDRAERAAKLHEAENMLAELCPSAPVLWYGGAYIASDELSGIKSDSWFGYFDFKKLKLSDWRDVNAKEEEESLARSTSK